jgi:hypothetical protein
MNQVVQSGEDSGLLWQSPVCYPFVKWAGGKKQVLDRLDDHVPKFSRYFEPFLGGGAMYFHLASERKFRFDAFLSDINKELVNTYKVARLCIFIFVIYQFIVRHISELRE